MRSWKSLSTTRTLSMASNSFGTLFRITTWGESHGKAIGVVIDGCPAGIELSCDDVNNALAKRAPGRSKVTSPRKEPDQAEILSGIYENVTTGAPISIIIYNKDADSQKYEPIKDLLRPGHANYTYLEKYGIFDYRGGGRASARETACRVAAGAVANKILEQEGIEIAAYLKQLGSLEAQLVPQALHELRQAAGQNPFHCPCSETAQEMALLLEEIKEQGDSVGGVVEFISLLPAGLGEPVYEKLEAKLASAMLSIPASKGFEIGSGFQAVQMLGSEHNDPFIHSEEGIRTSSNFAGGILGGISTGMPLVGRVAFKPASGIMKPQKSITTGGESSVFQLPEGSRHDPCVAIRAVPVVEAMLALVLADAILRNRSAKI